jgi:hypothetical protein
MYVYCASAAGSGCVKIGFTNNPCRRYRELSAVVTSQTFDFFVFTPKKPHSAATVERIVHGFLSEYHIEREVFAAAAIDVLMMVSGHIFESSVQRILDVPAVKDTGRAWAPYAIRRQVAPWMLAKGYLSIPGSFGHLFGSEDASSSVLVTHKLSARHSKFYALKKKTHNGAILLFGIGAFFRDTQTSDECTLLLSRNPVSSALEIGIEPPSNSNKM